MLVFYFLLSCETYFITLCLCRFSVVQVMVASGAWQKKSSGLLFKLLRLHYIVHINSTFPQSVKLKVLYLCIYFTLTYFYKCAENVRTAFILKTYGYIRIICGYFINPWCIINLTSKQTDIKKRESLTFNYSLP